MQSLARSTSTPEGTSKAASGSDGGCAPLLRGRILRATAWVILSKPLSMVLQLAKSLVLTRMLSPEVFGLMALVGVMMQGLQMCSDVGIGPSIIKSHRGDDPVFLQTAWTLQIIRGVGLWLVCCALAWPISLFYHEPTLLALVPVAGLNIIIGSLNTTAWVTHDRAMQRGRVTAIAYVAEILTMAAMIIAAWRLRSVWALVIAGLFGSVISLVLGHVFLPGVQHRFRWNRSAVHELVHFGKWVFLSTLLTFFAMQLDRLLLGRLIPMDLLGIYSIALVLANLPKDLVLGAAGLVLFPAMAEKHRQDPAGMPEHFCRARAIILRIGLLLCLGVIAVAPGFYQYLYDPRYAAAAWICQLLVLSVWVTIVNASTGYALLALGDSQSLALGNLANVLVTAAGAVAGIRLFGLAGFIVGYAVGTAVGEIVQGLQIRRSGLRVLGQDVVFTLLCLIASGACMGAVRYLCGNREGHATLAKTLVGLGLWLLVAACLLPAIKQDLAPKLRLPWFKRLRETVRLA